MKFLALITITLLFLSLNNCTNELSPVSAVSELDTIELDTIVLPVVKELVKEIVIKDSFTTIEITEQDSIFFKSKNLLEIKTNNTKHYENFNLEKKDRYNVIFSQKNVDTTLYFVMFLYLDNTYDIICNDFSESNQIKISTEIIVFNLINQGIVRFKIF